MTDKLIQKKDNNTATINERFQNCTEYIMQLKTIIKMHKLRYE